ncbi:unnamed protein product [Gongylonema pulchrum]|uniref:ATP-binding protein n=1 Tax=Gongylonema pulchrum TaxID=637853 RepID=A0A183DPL2_9BILA|nr:unnamed protein product [Gongylonema pulchrum]
MNNRMVLISELAEEIKRRKIPLYLQEEQLSEATNLTQDIIQKLRCLRDLFTNAAASAGEHVQSISLNLECTTKNGVQQQATKQNAVG